MRCTIVKKPFARFQNKINSKDTEELEQASDLLSNISKLKQHLCNYNANGVFTIVVYNSDDPRNIIKLIETLDLEELFSVTRDYVSKSNVWWHSVVESKETMTVHKNLCMSLLFFENKIEPKLYAIVMDKFKTYPAQEKIDPLYYIMIIELILNGGILIALL